MKTDQVMAIVRDAGCIVVGLGGIVHQTAVVPPGHASAALLGTFLVLLSGPVGIALWARRNGGQATTGPSTPSPELPSQQPESSSPSAP